MGSEAGQRLLHYQLVEKIGEGGMGSVWLARDTTLDRDVAIKVLPDGLACDQQFLRRFEREAKLLASLSHPNLAAVFGVHEEDGTRFLAMELIPGEDLSHRLKRGPLPPRVAVRIMKGIAEALEAAHAKGVIHRDLKPANVRLTPDDRIKVLDFGLAKTVEGDPTESDPGDVELTATGVVLGTAPYMSPEQARGHPVDARADVWSFGCVLWECLTGESPFRRGTVSDLIAAILNEEPDWDRLPSDTPPSVVRLLRRCLKKSRHERLHHIADARLELEDADAPPDAPAVARRTGRWIFPVLTAVLAVAFVVVLFLSSRAAPAARQSALAHATWYRLTDYPGDEIDAEISADGQFVAFLASDSGSKFDAFWGPIRGEYFNNVSGNLEGFRISGPKDWAVRRVGLQPDHKGLWAGGETDQHLRLISPGRDVSKDWLEKDTTHAAWSPDGKTLMYSLGTGGDPVFLADPHGSHAKQLELDSPEGHHQHFPTWSPDGEWIYLARGRLTKGELNLWRVRRNGKGLEQLTFPDEVCRVSYPAPLDARTVLFIGLDPDGSGPWLWELDVETKEVRRAVGGVGVYTSVSASLDGRRIVVTVGNPRARLSTFPLLSDRLATESDVKAYGPTRRALAPRIRGGDLFYLSSVDGRDGLWRTRDGNPEEIWPGGGAARLESACAVSPNGARIAMVVHERQRTRLYVMNTDGTGPRPLMDEVAVAGAPCWSPDSNHIAVGAAEGGLFRVDIGTGKTARISEREATNPVWDPGNRMIVFASTQVGALQHLLAVTPEGRELDFPEIKVCAGAARARFLPDGSGLVYLVGVDPEYDFHLLDLATRKSRPLTEFDSPATMRTFDVTQDGKTIIFDRQLDNADIWLIERDPAD